MIALNPAFAYHASRHIILFSVACGVGLCIYPHLVSNPASCIVATQELMLSISVCRLEITNSVILFLHVEMGNAEPVSTNETSFTQPTPSSCDHAATFLSSDLLLAS